MATTNINVRVDTELKQSAETLFNDLGLNMSTAITMFLKSAVSHNGIYLTYLDLRLAMALSPSMSLPSSACCAPCMILS